MRGDEHRGRAGLNHWRSWVLACALAVSGTSALSGAEPETAATPAAGNALEPLAFLAGSCWSGWFPDGKAEDTHCYRWVYGQHFLRDVHVVRGDKPDYHGETLYWWDARQVRPRYVYWNSDGGVSEGQVEVVEGLLRFPEERFRASDGKEQVYRSVWRRQGADQYVSVTELQAAGDWKEAWRITYKRKGPAPASGE